MSPRFIHDFDPVFLDLGPVAFYYYGLAYVIGFVGLQLWLVWRRTALGWPASHVYDFTIIAALSVLIFGRAFEIVVYEWEYFRTHPAQLLHWWEGGMASHGVLIGGVIGVWLFSRLRDERFVRLVDEIALPAAFFLAVGRIGNFINGEIVGSVTGVPWAVKFPDVEGFRHPVALYESAKNLLLIPILLVVRRRWPPGAGRTLSHFILWYGGLRLISDWFRDYPSRFLGIGAGQYFNLLMLFLGAALLLWFRKRSADPGPPARPAGAIKAPLLGRRVLLAVILVFYLLIPSSWSRGTLEYYRSSDTTRSGLRPKLAGAARKRCEASARTQPEATRALLYLDTIPLRPAEPGSLIVGRQRS